MILKIFKIIIGIVLFETTFSAFKINAQYITFSGEGLTSVEVENQTTGLTKTLVADNILKLGDGVEPGVVNMTYTDGEVLKFTATDGINKTIKTLSSIVSIEIYFDFTECMDGDGNHYPVVQIGSQKWMAENLKTTKYSNGEVIGTTDPVDLNISAETDFLYQWAVGADDANLDNLGRLYTFYAANDSRDVCPAGWHLPSDNEWVSTINYLGNSPGRQMKESGTEWWHSPNDANNISGFSARATGNRLYDGTFEYWGSRVNYWTSNTTIDNTTKGVIRRFTNENTSIVPINTSKKNGNAVRCVKGIGLDDSKAFSSFSTNGHTIYHLRPANVDESGIPAIVGASFDGTVVCYKPDGTMVWEKKVNDYFPFDLAVADIDEDGLDEVFVATGGGTVDALDDDGTLLWTYQSAAQLYQVCPVKTGLGNWIILTGGIEEELFSLNTSGQLLESYEAGDVVRHIRKGDIFGNGEDYVAVGTTSSGRNGKLSIIVMNPATLSVIWKKTNLADFPDRDRFMSMIIKDIDHDGQKDIVVSASWEYHGRILAYDYKGDLILQEDDPMVPKCNYRMLLLSDINLKDSSEEYIFGLYANYLIIYNSDGIIQSLLTSNYDFTNACFDSLTNTYYLGSSVAGGDGIYALHLDEPDWQTAFEAITPIGKLAKMEEDIERLKVQIQNFQPPEYQKQTNNIDIISSDPGIPYNNLHFTDRPYISQKYDNRTEVWCKDIDYRQSYDKTAEDIVNYVKNKEALGKDFYMVSGHGTAVYMPLETMEKAIIAGPNHFKGFVFAEFQKTDSRMQEIIQQIIFPLAEKCSLAGKKIVFENKNIFWGGTCYVPFWNNVLLNPKFSDVFVPALEESNSRTQEISLAGRVGLWSIGTFDSWLSRSIADNLCFDRMWEWSSPQVLSHFIRHLVYTSSLGADELAISIQQGPKSQELAKQLLPVFSMLEKGVVVVPQRQDVLSVPDLCLGMKSPPSDRFLDDGTNSHGYTFNIDDHSSKVFDRLGTYWGGAQIADYDFSKYGYGCEQRMLNFLPKAPYGLVAIILDKTDISKVSRFSEKVITDGEFFYSDVGQKYTAEEYKPIMLQKLEESAARLPILVKGDAAWSVVRIDSVHVRVTLVDPGFTDPAERNVEVVLQHLRGQECIDILSGEEIGIQDSVISITIPAGLFRIIDIKHSELDDISWPGIDNLNDGTPEKPVNDFGESSYNIYPNPGKGNFTISVSNNINISNVRYNIFNSSGKCIISKKSSMENELQVDLTGFPSGLYNCVIYLDEGIISAKYLIVEN